MSLSAPGGTARVEKLMGLAMSDVVLALERLLASLDLPYRAVIVSEEERHFIVETLSPPVQGSLEVRRMPEARVGGQIRLPRTRLLLLFSHIDDASRDELLRQLHLAFLRGGG